MREKAHTLSTESIVSSTPSAELVERCSSCGAPLLTDQRYCLQCGERRLPVSDFLRGGSAAPAAAGQPSSPPAPPAVGASPVGVARQQRNNTLTVIAGVGVLLLAMGVGVLIGRAGGSKQAVAPPEVITVGSTAGGGAATGAGAAEETLTDDWPSGTTKGYTVQLEQLPQEGTTVKAVAQAKTNDGAKGVSAVGVLKSEDFTSLAAGSYVVYSGVYHKRADAQKALTGLKKKFPGAKVIEVSNSSANTAGGGAKGSGGGSGSSVKNPAPPSVLDSLKNSKGKSYEEKSKNLPDVVSTG